MIEATLQAKVGHKLHELKVNLPGVPSEGHYISISFDQYRVLEVIHQASPLTDPFTPVLYVYLDMSEAEAKNEGFTP